MTPGCAAWRRASWPARTGSSAKPRAPPTSTIWARAFCRRETSRTSAIGGPGFPPVVIPGGVWTARPGRSNKFIDPDAPRIRAAAEAYHKNLVDHFLAASARSPVVRLRDGTAVPQIPSYVQRRGRSFGWICETLEGAMHLIITKAIDPKSVQAQWILKDYEDNLFLSNQYGYTLDDFDKYWFGRGGMSMQACLLLDVEAYLYRDDVKQALRAMFNAIALNHFPDVHMNTEHALPEMGDWRGDHYKTSDEANACGWLRYLFVREEGDVLLIGQAVPRDWLKPGQTMRNRKHRHLLRQDFGHLSWRIRQHHRRAPRPDAQRAPRNPPPLPRARRRARRPRSP